MKKALMSLLGFILFSYLLLLALLYSFQRTLMYPGTVSDSSPQSVGLDFVSEMLLPTPDGEQIQLWYYLPDNRAYTILYFHGNGGHMGFRHEKFSAFKEAGFGIVMMSWRGYGKSTGQPSEAANYADAQMVYEHLIHEASIAPESLLFYGESLGTGVAVELATRYQPAGLILEAPYTSVRDRAAEIYRIFPTRFLVKDVYDSLSKIGEISVPLLLFHGERDRVIPIEHGKQLFDAANEPKQAHFFPERGHDDFDADELAGLIADFLAAQPIPSAVPVTNEPLQPVKD